MADHSRNTKQPLVLHPNEGGASGGGFSHEFETTLRAKKEEVEKMTKSYEKNSHAKSTGLSTAVKELGELVKRAHSEEGGAGAEKQVKLIAMCKSAITDAEHALAA